MVSLIDSTILYWSFSLVDSYAKIFAVQLNQVLFNPGDI